VSFGDDLDRQRGRVLRAVREAGSEWAGAMRAHKLAPPDAGFASRLAALAEAAENEQTAWEHAHAAGLLWRPVPGAEDAEPPYELRPGTGRRGPAESWERFDAAVAELNRAITGSDAARVADAFGGLAAAASTLADAVAEEEHADGGAGVNSHRAAPSADTGTRAEGDPTAGSERTASRGAA
jgi:hypothetical protein